MAEKIIPTNKRSAGRPFYEPTEKDRQTVLTMVAAGIQHANIARCIGEKGIDVKTLKRHFKQELETAADLANASVAQSIYQQAKAGNTSAAIWWSKARMGWSEKFEQHNTGEVKKDITVTFVNADKDS